MKLFIRQFFLVILCFGYTIGQTSPDFTLITSGPIVSEGGNSYGCAWGDYDNDGLCDLFIANSQPPNFLYRNTGNGNFTSVSTLEITNGSDYSIAGTWADYNNDGYLDLILANYNGGANILYTWNPASEDFDLTSISGDRYSNVGNWGDYDNDGYLDIFVANDGNYFGEGGDPNNLLYHNNGDGTFETISNQAIVSDGGQSQSSRWVDCDNDSDLDLFVSNGLGTGEDSPNYLYRNDGISGFYRLSAEDLSEPTMITSIRNTIGSCWADFDNDGWIDAYVVNKDDQNVYYQNMGNWDFISRNEAEVGPILNILASISATAGDIDNDGDADLFVTTLGENNRLFLNDGTGKFTAVTSGDIVSDNANGVCAALADFDRDGFLDVIVTNRYSTNSLYHNQGNGNNWIQIHSIGTKSNRSAIGARLSVKAQIAGQTVWQYQDIIAQNGGSLGAQNSLIAHFGLADANIVDSIKVHWPSGNESVLTNINPNQRITIWETYSPPLIILPQLNDEAYPGTYYSYYPEISDSEQDDIFLLITDGPAWLSVMDNTYFAGTPGNSSIGTRQIRLRADDLFGGITDTSYTLTVINNLPPMPVTDLRLNELPAENAVWIEWTAPGNHWNDGQATSYDFRYSETFINESNFDNATSFPVPNSPASCGQTDSLELTGLLPATKYYCAIKSINTDEQISSISNILSFITSGDGQNFPPEIVSHLFIPAEVGILYQYNESNRALAVGSAPITWSKIEGPEDFSISSDGLIEWIPSESDAVFGSLLIIIRASNAYGQTDDSLTVIFSENLKTEYVTTEDNSQFLDYSEAGIIMPDFENDAGISGSVTVSMIENEPQDPGMGSSFSLADQYWVVESNIPDQQFTTSMVFSYDENTLGAIPESELVILYRQSATDSWQVYPDQERDEVQNTITIHNVTHFSAFGPGDDLSTSQLKTEKEYHPNSYQLFQNYPNPFNPTTTIRYQLEDVCDVELTIYNVLGQKVTILVNEKQQAGPQHVNWDASGYPSGIYYYRIVAGEFQQVQKMILLR